MKRLILVLICLFICPKVSAYYSSDPSFNGGYVMPDLYNTGPVTDKSLLVDFGTKYPEVRKSDTTYLIDAKSAEKYNYVFETFKSDKQIIVNGVSNVTIRDFTIDLGERDFYAFRTVAYNGTEYPSNILVTDGEITGSKSAVFNGGGYTARRLYIHDYNGDAFKAGNNQVIESCYIGSGGLKEGAHADGMQISFEVSNVKILGNRFDMIAAGGTYKANATLFLSLEADTADNVVVNHNWLNGGGYTMYLFEYERGKFTNASFKNNIFGNGKRFGYMNTDMHDRVQGLSTSIYAEDVNVPFIGSIVFYNQNGIKINDLKDTKGKLKLLVNAANYTSNSQNLIVVAKLHNYKNELVKTISVNNIIMRNMPGREYLTDKGGIIKVVSLNDFPQNVPTILEFTDLPSDLSGYYVDVAVYKDSISNQTLRTARLNNSITKIYKLVDLNIVNNKSTYKVGDILRKEDLVVTAIYSDNTFRVIDNYTISKTNELSKEDKTVVISYNDTGVNITKEIGISVIEEIKEEIEKDVIDEEEDIEVEKNNKRIDYKKIKDFMLKEEGILFPMLVVLVVGTISSLIINKVEKKEENN